MLFTLINKALLEMF